MHQRAYTEELGQVEYSKQSLPLGTGAFTGTYVKNLQRGSATQLQSWQGFLPGQETANDLGTTSSYREHKRSR